MEKAIKLNGITYTYNATEKQQYIIEMLEDKEYFSSKYWIVRDITLTAIKIRIKLGQAPFKTINEKDIKRAIEIVENAISKHEGLISIIE